MPSFYISFVSFSHSHNHPSMRRITGEADSERLQTFRHACTEGTTMRTVCPKDGVTKHKKTVPCRRTTGALQGACEKEEATARDIVDKRDERQGRGSSWLC